MDLIFATRGAPAGLGGVPRPIWSRSKPPHPPTTGALQRRSRVPLGCPWPFSSILYQGPRLGLRGGHRGPSPSVALWRPNGTPWRTLSPQGAPRRRPEARRDPRRCAGPTEPAWSRSGVPPEGFRTPQNRIQPPPNSKGCGGTRTAMVLPRYLL